MTDARFLRLTWTTAGQLSDEAEAPIYLFPVAVRVPATWTTAEISLELKGQDGVWYHICFGSDRLTIPAGPAQYPIQPDTSLHLALTSRASRLLRARSWPGQNAGSWIELLFYNRRWP